MSEERLSVLYEDNSIIVCHKPAGIATQTARIGQADMYTEVTKYLAQTGGTARPYVGLIHRLDQPVEGILAFAKDKKAAAELSRQISQNSMVKIYAALVCGKNIPQNGELVDYLLKDGKSNTSSVVPEGTKDAKRAVLSYEVIKRLSDSSLKENSELAYVKINLSTGRHHQIRVQMAHAGMSLLGDFKYAKPEIVAYSESKSIKSIALCACELSFLHPITKAKMHFQIEPKGKSFAIISGMGKGEEIKE